MGPGSSRSSRRRSSRRYQHRSDRKLIGDLAIRAGFNLCPPHGRPGAPDAHRQYSRPYRRGHRRQPQLRPGHRRTPRFDRRARRRRQPGRGSPRGPSGPTRVVLHACRRPCHPRRTGHPADRRTPAEHPGVNAGATPHAATIQDQTWTTFGENWNVDVRHVFEFVRAAPLAPLDPGSAVISLSSGAARQGSPMSGG